MKFREKTPSRRIDTVIKKDYHSYKEVLKEDFNSRCGYCDDHEYFSREPYQIDHFAPRTILKTMGENDYSNLVYSCRRCNRSKWDKWPTADETKHNNGVEGFIDPCDPAYDQQFERNNRGEIIPITPLGEWMWKELDLKNAAHRIIWNLTQVRIELDLIRKDPHVAKDNRIIELCERYIEFEDELRGSPHF